MFYWSLVTGRRICPFQSCFLATVNHPPRLHFALQSLIEVETRLKQALININIVWIISWHLFALRVHEDQIREPLRESK